MLEGEIDFTGVATTVGQSLNAAAVRHGVEHRSQHEVEPPLDLGARQFRQCLGDRLDQALDERPDPARLAELQSVGVSDLGLDRELIGACACRQPMTIDLISASLDLLTGA